MGGFTEGKKVLALAQAYMIQVIPHMWGTGVGFAAGLQFLANIPPMPLAYIPDEPMIEYDLSEQYITTSTS
ncbi:MAG: enolase C-terminal domain-like protein [Oscillospiraceae bacterium]